MCSCRFDGGGQSRLNSLIKKQKNKNMKNICNNANFGFTKWCVALIATFVTLSGVAQAQTTIVGWDFANGSYPGGNGNFGPSPAAANTVAANVTSTGLTRSGLGTTGTAAASAWGGTATAAGSTGSASFTVKANDLFTLSLTQISAYNVRRSSSGPTTGQWAYSLNGVDFVNIGSAITWGSVTSGTGNAQVAITLSDITALQNVPATTTVTFRVTLTGSSGTGTWYLNNLPTAGNDFVVTGTVAAAAGSNPLLQVALSPNPVAETAGSSATTGTVTVPSAPASNLVVNLNSANTSAATVPGSVTILAGETSATFGVTVVQNSSSYDDQSSLITASASNYTSGTETVKVTNTDKRPMTVVINKFINATPDKAELLVVGNGTPGQTVDMRGMIFKDFSGSMAGDGGAQYTFTTSTLWAAVPVGTLIVLSNDNTAGDIDAADFKLAVGLDNTIYFTKTGGTFDIATTEMLMVKVAGSSTVGTSGGIHALAAGTAGTYYTDFVGYKLIATGTTGTDQGVYANNSIGVLTDFDGTDATGSAVKTDAALTFGAASTAGNATFIASLRGTDPTDGSGAVTLANSTAGSPYALSPIFAREATGQNVSLNLTGILADKTISDVTVLVPELLGLPLVSNVTLTGTGAASAVVTVNGQLITVTGAAVTTTGSMTINVSGLSTPPLANLSSNLGNLPFTVSTARAGGSLKAVGASPSAFVLMPIETIRAVEINGTPTHNGKVVAVEGVCTDTSTSTGTAPAFLQDGEHGVAIFSAAITKVFTQATRYAVAGTVGSFNGLTQVNPLSLSAIVEVGAGTLPTPRVITLPLSFADAELYEGSLVQIANVSKASSETDDWGASKTITVTDGTNPMDIRIQANSTATTEPGYPATITGILGQYDSSVPRNSGYQIMPRTPEDLSFAPELTISSSQADYGESDGPFAGTLTIGRRGSAVGTLSVTISASVIGRVTIQDSADLVTIEFADGQVSKTVDLGIVDDSIVSASSQVVLSVISVPAGAATSSSVTINITDNDTDTTKPVITLLGANPLSIANGATYTDPGAKVTDNVDAERTITGSGTVNTAVQGDYTVTYNATDAAGNAAIAVLRTVRVAAPVVVESTYAEWSGGATLDSAGLAKYAIGGASSLTANDGVKPTTALTGGFLVITAIVRTDNSNLTLVGEAVTDLANYASGTSVTVVQGVEIADQSGVPAGHKRKTFSVAQGTDARKFMRLSASLALSGTNTTVSVARDSGGATFLQVTGATAGATGGGTATSDKRSIYYYAPDTNSSPTYTGSAWPYVIVRGQLSAGAGVTATVTKNPSGVLLVNGLPAYQFGGDSGSTTANGVGGAWPAMRADGTKTTTGPSGTLQ